MNAAKFWLSFVSFLFYGWWNPDFLLMLIGSILFNYICGHLIQTHQERHKMTSFILAIGILGNLALLFYFKYLLTLMKWFHGIGFYHGQEWGSLILPLGISFFTFTQIGYLIDSQDDIEEERGFLEYVLFVTFFPHLIAGPIVHHGEIMPQFAKKETYFLNWDNIGVGISIFIIGLAKKVLIADQFASVANDVFGQAADQSVVGAWTGVLSYSFQLYFDFAGYSEMALGLARMFNVKFPANFDSPYKSKSIIEFWQRWHISLTRYFTLYLYNPVSHWIIKRRAAKGLALLKAEETTLKDFLILLAVPTLYTMILIGVWHGAGFQFFIFGLLHGCYLCVNQAWRMFGPKVSINPVSRFRFWFDRIWKWGLTYLSVLFSFVFFKSKSVTDAWELIRCMIGRGTENSVGVPQGVVESILDYFGVPDPFWNYSNSLITLVAGFMIILLLPNVLQLFEKEGASLTKIRSAPAFFSFHWRPNVLWGFLLAVLALADLLMVTGYSEFLYFRF